MEKLYILKMFEMGKLDNLELTDEEFDALSSYKCVETDLPDSLFIKAKNYLEVYETQ